MNKVGKWLRRKYPKLYYKIIRLDKCKNDKHEYDCMGCNKAANCNRYIDLGVGEAKLRMIGETRTGFNINHNGKTKLLKAITGDIEENPDISVIEQVPELDIKAVYDTPVYLGRRVSYLAGEASKELMQSLADELVNNGSLG